MSGHTTCKDSGVAQSEPARSYKEYLAVQQFYGTQHAMRSGVPCLNHIDEGLAVLRLIGASEQTKRAFCLHPLLQHDDDLAKTFVRVATITDDPQVLTLAMEYRHIANATLSSRAIDASTEISLGPLPEIRHMLIADKLQNRKDFLRYHATTHPRRVELRHYFDGWLARLGVDETLCREAAAAMNHSHAEIPE